VTTQSPEVTGLRRPDDEPDRPATGSRRPWWRRPWMVPLALVAGGFLFLTLPKYLTLDPAQTPVQIDPGYPLHYPLLLGHVGFGTISLACVCLLIWPWLRRQHPAAHRRIGRLYVFGGVLPTAALALAIVPFSHGPAGNAAAAVLWVATTVVGYRMARQDREEDHRRWMVYSFAMTLQIVWGRVMFLVLPLVPGVTMTDPHTLGLIFETATWIGFVINLTAAQVYLELTARRAATRPS
jgi:hypothetical protein